ncbi:NUDIX domain-containing protein [Marinitenerispora sediminis]|uniref:NUDIX hydrolase n=1 Tax=Marinitenerispora sediminis TaxID=1931232 RepID=A0A368T7L7_9ACTN|nr:NUDIX domain-containing protein [Marinitenerispora sediminis]RCV56014.1 NUDIX hydrolase [Marinitenerispora sediminis]RCV57751.1 NUDIX hydrolase [Marinitenerispora sediminis]RCV60998.1 NUDIX hydrolase [Marinitenerispora sediminis]
MSVCDLQRVGVLVRNADDEYLMFERAAPPAGVAPAAGHLNGHGSFTAAARAKVFEVLGLTAVGLERLASGFQPDRCRRDVPPGRLPGHEWHVYRARIAGELAWSKREVHRPRWMGRAQLQSLAERTGSHARDRLREHTVGADRVLRADAEREPGLAPVWVHWLAEAGVIRPVADMAAVRALSAVPPNRPRPRTAPAVFRPRAAGQVRPGPRRA